MTAEELRNLVFTHIIGDYDNQTHNIGRAKIKVLELIKVFEQSIERQVREGIRDACYSAIDGVFDDYEKIGLSRAAELAMTTPIKEPPK